MTGRDDILRKVKDVPSLPSVVIKLRSYLNDPEVTFDQLAKVIEFDPGLTANVLQLANSAYFGWSRSIKTVQGAITRLGTNRIFQMVLCMSVAPLVRKPIKGYEMEAAALWEHSIATALCADSLAKHLKTTAAEEAFTAGLLHDMGKVILGTFVEIDDEPIMEIVAKDRLAFNEAEMMVLGIDHAEAAAELLQTWNLPPEVVAAARWHHAPSRCTGVHRTIVDLTHVADVLCMNVGWGLGTDGLLYRYDEEAGRRLGLDAASADAVLSEVMAGVEDLKTLFKSARQCEPQPVGGGRR